MFEFLKKKISGLTDKLKETISGKQKEARKPRAETSPETQLSQAQNEVAQEAAAVETPAEQAPAIADSQIQSPSQEEIVQENPLAKPERAKKEKKPKKAQAEQVAKEDFAPPQTEFEIAGEDKSALEKIKEIRGDEKRDLRAKVGITKKLFGFLGGKIKISESEIGNFFDEFELGLLESDVEQDAALAIVRELKSRIVGREIGAGEEVTKFLKAEIRASLEAIMRTEKIDLLSLRAKPVKILFLGPNGAGKTTSIAKVAKYLMDRGKSAIMAAGDTFRAASIEQLETHAAALGVKVVKHKYGSDPTAVAFDAVKAAEAKGIDFILIDTAGRQETNKNLLEELKKIERVIKPDLKIYIGEAYTGQALLQQASEFDKAIGIDGFILTKIDTDAKGGTAISLLYALKKPIIFVGTGQRYSDLLEFRPEFIIERII